MFTGQHEAATCVEEIELSMTQILNTDIVSDNPPTTAGVEPIPDSKRRPDQRHDWMCSQTDPTSCKRSASNIHTYRTDIS